jgi:hypothetical protein
MAMFFVGCDSTGPGTGESEVSVGFATASSSASTSPSARPKAQGDSLVLNGTNGTLRVHDLRLIVDELSLEGEADSAEFETERPFFLDLPLDTTEVASVVNDRIPPGTYNEFEFEVEDAELDDGDDEGLQALRDDIDAAGFSNWPNNASMVVQGTFTPENDTARSFTTYFEAEIEVELEMEDRPFVIGGDDPTRRLTVNLDPRRWFSNPDGTVQDLSQDDYGETGQAVEFELEYEFEDGVSEIEFD